MWSLYILDLVYKHMYVNKLCKYVHGSTSKTGHVLIYFMLHSHQRIKAEKKNHTLCCGILWQLTAEAV